MRFFMLAVLATGGVLCAIAEPILSSDDMQFLEGITKDVVQASRVAVGDMVGAIGPNTTGGTLIRPGGRECYPAFWIRDYAMSIDSGFVSLDEQRHMLLLTARAQQDDIWNLPSGSVVTPGSIPDHIAFGGNPIFYPGTLDDYVGQGGPRWGKLPSLDDAFFFVRMASLYVESSGSAAILDEDVEGKPLFQRLEEAYAMPPFDPETGLVRVDESNRGVTFGFVDTIVHTGDLLFCSLLKWRAARELAMMAAKSGRVDRAERYALERERLRAAISGRFLLESGWLQASTEISSQADVWGTAFAVYEGALLPEHEQRACQALRAAYRAGTISWQGNIRHVAKSADFSATTAWEKTDVALNTYQNGAYWGTPTGWVVYAIAKIDGEAARQLATEFVEELRAGDFRKGPEFGSPWECMHPQNNYRQNPVYMTSVACPLAAFRRIEIEMGPVPR